MIQNITVRILPEWKGKISALCKTAEEMKSNPGVTENSAIFSKESVELSIEHPYAKLGKADPERKYKYWKDLELTPLEIGPNTLCAKPYAWIMFEIRNGRFNKSQKNWEKYGMKIDKNAEKNWYINGNFNPNGFVNGDLGENNGSKTGCFLQMGKDQKIAFDKFFCNVKEKESLCFVYAKWAEFTENPQRILVGIGRVLNKQEPPQYDGKNEIECRLWETRLQHNIEMDGEDCVLLPYDELQKYAEGIKNFNIDDYVVFASDDFRSDFSYGAEWLSYDGAIDTLLRTEKVLEKLDALGIASFEKQREWLKKEREKIYEDRWIYPGLGEMLYAFGLKSNWQEISEKMVLCMKDNGTPFKEALRQTIREYQDQETRGLFRQWNDFPNEEKDLFELLSRMALSEKHAQKFFKQEFPYGRWESWVECEKILKNPYLVYELFPSKNAEEELPFVVVDNAMFPNYSDDREVFEIPALSKMANAKDPRRVHALVVKVLKSQEKNGNSIYPAELIREDIANEVLSRQCSPSISDFEKSDLLTICDSFERIPLKLDGKESFGFQLKSCRENKDVIKREILHREQEKEESNENWERICEDLAEDSDNQREAKKEKINLLSKMASSKIFVLTGGAGTGKTTLLSLFTSSREIRAGGVLALAPTGKAMVRMKESFEFADANFDFRTIASFLMKFNRYKPESGRYDYRGRPGDNCPEIPSTVIIDECSMLTEDMLAALLVTIKDDADRIILSGDANQLPPIGCGRPFLDILTYFKSKETNQEHPTFGDHFGELQITMRQDGKDRLDLAFAQCFKRSCTPKDLKFFRQDAPDDERLKIKAFGGLDDLETVVHETLNNDLEISQSEILAEDVDCVDDWEILSPTRNDKFGSLTINEIVRKLILDEEEKDDETISKDFIPVKQGDKIICTVNRRNDITFNNIGNQIPDPLYVANGDIGYVSEIEQDGENGPKKYHVEYKGQKGYYHRYNSSDFKNMMSKKEEPPLEYAYALTVHKCQGSQFAKTLVVLNTNSLMLSRELLYTAFSRQKDKLVVLFNGDFRDLKKYCHYTFSAVAKRLTNLMMDEPDLRIEDGVCFDDIYTKQDAEVAVLYKEQIKKETASKEAKTEVVEKESRATEISQENLSIFGRLFRKVKSLFRR